MLKIATLEKATFEQISEAFNTSFSDYFLPARLSAEQLNSKFLSEGGRLDLSVGIFDNDKLVSFILHFIKIKNGQVLSYNGGTGVIPTFRGKRLTSKMYDFILPLLIENNVDKMLLEVLNVNHSAFKIYQSIGFRKTRELNCFKGKLNINTIHDLDESYEIKKIEHLDWKLLQSFWDSSPAWAHSISTMNNLLHQNLCIGIKKDNLILGYLIYTSKTKRIHQFAIHKKYRNIGLGTHLLNYLYKIENGDISFINVDSKIPNFKQFLEKRGFKNNITQYEMECPLR